MKRTLFLVLALILTASSIYSQYADLGTGALKDKIWWFNWSGFTIANNASRTFITDDGLTVTITFSNVAMQTPVPAVMNTWSGAILHLLYNFSDPSIQPAIHSLISTVSSKFSMTITATRNNVQVPFTLVTADAEASYPIEITTLTTNGSNWSTIDFFRNSSQSSNPLTGCNTQTVKITDTYGGSTQNGQNPVLSTSSLAGTPLQLDIFMEKLDNSGMALAFGILAPLDRGDLPATYGFAQHQVIYTSINNCSYTPPYPFLSQNENLKIGSIAGDADGIQTIDDGPDEDGLTGLPYFDESGSYSITLPLRNTTGADAYITAWFDYDQSGTFSANEAVTVTLPHNSTEAIFQWTGLPTSMPITGDYAFRFRICSELDESQNITGLARDGEVEDYLIPGTQLTKATASFTSSDTVCVNSPVTITNTSVNASSYYWSFCSASLANTVPIGTNLGNISGNLSQPVFMDYVRVGNNYYGFVMNHIPGGLIRLDFGNSLLNTPTSVNLGDFGGIIPSANGSEGIQLVNNEGKWYAIIVGGNALVGTNPRILKIDFGADITNPNPIATDWGNIGNLDQPVDLHVFKENNNWYGFTVNAENNTITRFDFSSSFDNVPTGTNIGSPGGIAYPTGIYAISDNGFWRVFVTNSGDNVANTVSSLTRLDFGNSLLNIPTGINLGNPGNVLNKPRDITILKSCDEIIGFAVNGSNEVVRLNFNNDLSSTPNTVSLGNIGNLDFSHSISRLFRVDQDIYTFVTNVYNNTITRLRFPGCTNASIPGFQGADPPQITYDQPGTYNINLTIDDGLPTQTTFCKQIVVLPNADFSFEQEICTPLAVNFFAAGNNITNPNWTFGDGNINTTQVDPVNIYQANGDYNVRLSYTGACPVQKTISVALTDNDIIITPDTVVCEGATKLLRTKESLNFCWSPSTYLDDPLSPNPTTSTPQNITYYFTALVTGNNIITNGDFSRGNSDFTSEYNYSNTNTIEGEYNVGPDPQAWNISLNNCADHTTGNGNMMLVNGASTPDITIWKQTVTVIPNTNYAFSTWIQSLFATNPATLQFSINGQETGSLITASLPVCTWAQFYTTWNSGNNTSAIISIINKNTQVQGNDFALDDISFAPLFTQRDSVVIIVEKPFIQTNEDTTVCGIGPVQLSTTGTATYVWNPATGLSNANIANPIASPVNTTKYIVTGTTVNGCVARDSLTITTNPNPIVTITNDTLICYNTPTQLQATGGTTYSWSPVTGLDNPNIPTPVVTTNQSSIYNVTVTDVNNCQAEESVTITVRPYPAFSASTDQIICGTTEVQLNASGGDNYLWSPAAMLNDPTSAQPVTVPNKTTDYSVYISENTCGFDTTINMKVEVTNEPALTAIPNAFTPNGDGKNDCFGIRRWGNAQIAQFAIYNRWGQIVFQTKDPSKCWDGTFNGRKQDAGGYVYVIKATTICGAVFKKGIVTLVR